MLKTIPPSDFRSGYSIAAVLQLFRDRRNLRTAAALTAGGRTATSDSGLARSGIFTTQFFTDRKLPLLTQDWQYISVRLYTVDSTNWTPKALQNFLLPSTTASPALYHPNYFLPYCPKAAIHSLIIYYSYDVLDLRFYPIGRVADANKLAVLLAFLVFYAFSL